MNRDSKSHVKHALVNLLGFPGLGSLRAGRHAVGIGQVILFLAGCGLMLGWVFEEVSQYYGLMFENEKPRFHAGLGVSGAVLLGLSWAWAALTSLSLFREASKTAPPRLPVLPTNSQASADPEIQSALAALPHWKQLGNRISRTYVFPDFAAAMKFVNDVAQKAESAQHHPDIDVRWNQVTLSLTTDDAGGLTEKDFAMARLCDVCLG